MNEKVKIIQLIPAPAGMSAVFENDHGGEYEERVICLALTEGVDGVRAVVPVSMDDLGCASFVTFEDNFAMVLFDGDHLRKEEEIDLSDPAALQRAYEAEDRQQFRHLYGLE